VAEPLAASHEGPRFGIVSHLELKPVRITDVPL
jgi:hypothetical protein